MSYTFSSMNRQEILRDMEGQSFDVLVIGGGITGAGIALDAQARGMKTALLEMQDFAAGTSSRSTKLVHGGLRYLKQLEFKLVAEVGKERAIVYENAPHVTTPEWMLLPMIEGGTYGKFATSIGLRVYDTLAGVKKSERRVMLSKEETLKKEPLLRTDKLKGGGYYVEYRTDDARLTIEVMKEAVRLGAQAVNYVKVQDLLYENGKVVGVVAVDQITGTKHDIRAKKVVNAAGPWVDKVREIDGSKKGKRLHLTKGVHLVIDGKRFPLRQAVYFDTPDGRMVFAIPRDGKTYVGTTDTDYHGDIANPKMTTEDRDYILRAANFMFPTLKLTKEDVESSWAGLRPLIHEEGKSPSELSRKDEIFISESGLLSIAGGKLTGYRKMAERIVDLVASQLKEEGYGSYPGCTTDKIRLSGGDVGGSDNFGAFVRQKTGEGVQVGLSTKEADKLTRRYGSNIDCIYEIIRERQAEAEASGLPKDVFGSLVYAIEAEMATTPEDYFVRRTGALYFDIRWVERWKEPVIAYMARKLGWTEEETARHRARLEQLMHDAVVPQENEA
ncbi:glycerol-3-phosphate dehydrogenase/oxidase [Aneurinibacillus thermoaerophilus]|uniref:Glycerol-3-phosphate dehydrogenase n=1 Tax=Aneurinibacillus thermoaerophilus TaxID=143495 RepID=A0A1G8C6V8_ANETH|nr:glycerol-3-phosphate dehydrogenase/oxidase [Aneurinibacillus thermoaerophilus]MED0757481.1 glycerol-3-phosphate dehydrogenase/oxidase [Aneurinibacillus thermoaerophilus]MED0761796.1 glycerol-3-phosphate dehydrogenase/oxidase [Aneurinibacillus thermoaerophilus]SDH40999.1 homodimeric glycerol 3-phosphate dehydrogenase (quinone) [Aneurinibacillus thermoaerophilus]